MTKISSTFLIIISLLFFNNYSKAQAFQKGNKNLDIGIGFGAYGTTQSVTTTINGVSFSDSESDGAVSSIIPIRFEYGVGEKISVGAEFFYNNYVVNDSDKVNLNSVKAIDFGVTGSFHLLNSDKNDLFIGLGIGVSSITIDYASNINQFIESVSGSGMYFSLGITDRIFFSDHIGILFNLGYRAYNYSSLEADFTSGTEAALVAFGVTDYSQTWEWKFKGVHIGTGLAIKF